jgi:hypothetical protein
LPSSAFLSFNSVAPLAVKAVSLGQFLLAHEQVASATDTDSSDEAGGLGFVGEAHRFFSVILFAFSISAAGALANDVVYDKIPLPYFAPLIATFV